MVGKDILARGVERGIITVEQAEHLRALDDDRELEAPASPDDEQLRFINGFSDIFVALGIAMVVGALGYFTSRSFGPVGMWVSIAVTSWLLAEFFTRVRRMALPSIILLVTFAFAVFVAGGLLLGAKAEPKPWWQVRPLDMYLGLDSNQPTLLAYAALMTVILTAGHYWRFRVPITISAGCAALTIAAVGFAYGLVPELKPAGYTMIILVCGLLIFVLAMRFDMSDPERRTRRTDIAFWLHLLAAPLIVHSLIKGLASRPPLDPATALAIIAVFLGLGLVAVLIDRRAMLVSGLSYAGYALAILIRQAGLSDVTTPATVLALGAFVLLLSAGWRPLRTAILGVAPSALTRHLPQATAQN